MSDDPRVALLLALADDDLVIGHRHSHWTGVAPHLEEDMAFSSISQDEIGHAVVWYSLAAELTGKDPDALGLGRQPDGYRNAVLLERPNRDWGFTIARHHVYDVFEDVRLTALADSKWSDLANATGAIRREERYHLLHARAWVERLAQGPVEGRHHLSDGFVAALAEAPGLFEALPGEEELVADGVLPVSSEQLRRQWLDAVRTDLAAHDLDHVLGGSAHHLEGEFVATSSGELIASDEADSPSGGGEGLGGRLGHHSADFTELWDEMTGTYRAYPGVTW